MRTALFQQWYYERQFILPDEEELKLKGKLQQALNREAVRSLIASTGREKPTTPPGSAASSASARSTALVPRHTTQDDVPYSYHNDSPFPVPSSTSITAAIVGYSKLMAYRNLFLNPDGTRRPLSFPILTPELRSLVFSYLPVVEGVWLADLKNIQTILDTSDAEILRDIPKAVSVVKTIQVEIMKSHAANYGNFAVVARSLGLQPDCSHPSRGDYKKKIAVAMQKSRALLQRYDNISKWTTYRESTLHTPCAELRQTLRSDLKVWFQLLKQWLKDSPEELALVAAIHEWKSLYSRVGGVEMIGNPNIELDDLRNMFWELNLEFSEFSKGVTADYAKTLTPAQCITLGIIDLPWVKGYVWEDRETQLEEELQQLLQMAESAGAGPGAGTSAVDQRRQELLQQISQPQMILQQKAREQEALRLAEEAEQRRVEEEKKLIERRRAAQVAADQMTQRHWISTQPYQHRWQHQFTGCEYCTALPIHQVGLKKECSGALTDIALCQGCFNEMYSDPQSVSHRMYDWFVVRDLIGEMSQELKEKEIVNGKLSEVPPLSIAVADTTSAEETPQEVEAPTSSRTPQSTSSEAKPTAPPIAAPAGRETLD